MVLERLRRETRELHEQIDSRMALSGPELTLAHYIDVLGIMLAFFEPWELALDRFAAAPGFPEALRDLWRSGLRAHKLRDDLRSLGAQPDPALTCDPPPPATLGDWLGSFYVLEGSRLGGQFIAREVESRLGWTGGLGYSFFAADPRATGARWRQVCAVLEAHAAASNDIVAGAHRTFASLEAILNKATSHAASATRRPHELRP